MTIRLFNTLSKTIEDFQSVSGGSTVKVYTCGPTVYNYIHIGNIRSFLFSDLLQRVLRIVGKYDVQWVMNITDIDDKTIRDSAIGSKEWLNDMGIQSDDPNHNLRLFTEYFAQKFIEDIQSVGIQTAHFHTMPRATDYIEPMQQLIRNIIDNGYGYVSEGNVYFALGDWMAQEHYGKLFTVDTEHFKAGVRIDADEYDRESVSDFVLWKARKNNEPYWDFPYNGYNLPGRPGWHIECSAMGQDILGLPLDIHTGGVDLRFPHHEDEIAQSKAGYGLDTANYWCHNEFLEVEGKKMSKSLGNFYTLRDITDKGYDPLDIRFLMLSGHYSSVINFTFSGLDAVQKARKRVQDFVYALFDTRINGDASATVFHDVATALADNLHTPKALEILFSFINNTNPATLTAESKLALIEEFRTINDIFGVWNIEAKPQEHIIIPDEIIALAERRLQAKKDKNFAEADSLRAAIAEKGYTLKDTKEGYTLEVNER
ncbi:MAG: cysteine--tRNA ligase [Candidatus Kapabacteria bacterium]|nr:cysteine--tRNA ligase [Candidatus Kapabacteria bacterium]